MMTRSRPIKIDNATDENTVPNKNLLANDSDEDSLALTVVAINGDDTQVGEQLVLATGGLLTVNSDGTFDFDPNGEYEDLAVGESRTDSFTYRITDNLNDPNNQGFDTATATIAVFGVNDAPILSAESGDSNAETVIEMNSGLTISGTLTVSDVDTTDFVTASVLSVATSGKDDDAATPDKNTLLSYFAITPTAIIDNSEVSDTITWTFNSGNEAFDYLAHDEALVLDYTIEALDDEGATDTETVTVAIDGTNDRPIAQNLSFTIGEDDSASTWNFLASDVDRTDVLSYQILEQETTEFEQVQLVTQPVDESGNQYGQVTNNGNGTFTFNPLDDFQFLNTGESRDVTFEYVAIDDSGASNDTGFLFSETFTLVETTPFATLFQNTFD